jgi:hypothetical protein
MYLSPTIHSVLTRSDNIKEIIKQIPRFKINMEYGYGIMWWVFYYFAKSFSSDNN